MSKVTRDDMALESGLADDIDAAIAEAYFEVKAEYAAKSGTSDPMLMLRLESPDLDQPMEQGWSCGGAKQWEITKGGKEIISAVKPEGHQYNVNARAGKLVARMFELVGGGDKTKGQDFFLKRDKYMTQGEFYENLSFHWKREGMATVSGGTSQVLMPNAFLGEAKSTKAAKKEEANPELIEKFIALANGKTLKELKISAIKEFKGPEYSTFIKTVLNGELIEELEAQDKIAEVDDKFVAL